MGLALCHKLGMIIVLGCLETTPLLIKGLGLAQTRAHLACLQNLRKNFKAEKEVETHIDMGT